MPNRRSLLVALAVAVLAAIAVGGVFGVRLGDAPAETPSPAADASAAHDAPTGSLPGRTERRSGTSHRGSESVPEPDPSATAQAPRAPRPSTAEGGVLVLPEAAGPATEYRLPGLGRPAAPDFDPPAEAGSARGRLVAGYPARLLPRAPRSAVVSSSVAPSTGRAQVALVARRPAGGAVSPSRVLLFYRTTLGAAGFREVSTDAVGGARAAAFRRGADRVVVTVDPAPARTYSVYATLVTGGA